MWTFSTVERTDESFGQWFALVTLVKNDVPESFYIKFDAQPSTEQAASAGTELALKKNLEEAAQVTSALTRAAFVERFSIAEIGRIYAAAPSSPLLLAFTKKLEFNDTIHLNNPDTIAGVNLLEQFGLLDGVGRASQILRY